MASDVMDTGEPGHVYPHGAAHRWSALNSNTVTNSSKESPSPWPHSLRLPNSNSRTSDPIPPQRNSQHLRRHRSYTTLPIESLVRKLSKQSLRPHDSQNSIRRRPSSIDLHRSPALRSDVFSNVSSSSGQRDEFLRPSTITQVASTDKALQPDGGPNQPPLRQRSFIKPHPVESLNFFDPTLHWQAVPVADGIESKHTVSTSSGADEGYCEGDDDLSWLDNEDAAALGLAGHLRRRGLLKYRSSQEAAMQCSTKLVRNEPRMRRRRKQKERRLSTATNVSQATDILSSSITQLPSLTSSPPHAAALVTGPHG